LRVRGFNQSELLAEELSRITGWRVELGLLRVRDTASQVGLSARQRRDNVAGAFDCAHEPIPPTVILVDDVCTTGATLAECAAALRAKGAEKVFGVVVAKAVEP
jgi:ComF family protein